MAGNINVDHSTGMSDNLLCCNMGFFCGRRLVSLFMLLFAILWECVTSSGLQAIRDNLNICVNLRLFKTIGLFIHKHYLYLLKCNLDVIKV